jgi:undecaprenyl-diphosphatase
MKKEHRDWLTIILLLSSVVLTVLVAAGMTENFDRAGLRGVLELRTPSLTWALKGAILLGSFWGVAAATAIGAFVLYLARDWRSSAVYLSLVAAGSGLAELLKVAIARPRPDLLVDLAGEGFSYPSSHTAATVCCYLGLALLLGMEWKAGRKTMLLAAGVLAGAVGFSRLYRGWHYPSDVLGGALIGLCMVLLFGRLLRCWQVSSRRPWPARRPPSRV